MRLKWCLVLLIFCVLLCVAGCGSSAKTGAPRGDAGGAKETGTAKELIDPRTLLTGAEAESALGEPVKEPKFTDSKNPMGQKLCFYEPVDENSFKFVQIGLVQNEGMTKNLRDSGYNVKQLYEETKKNLIQDGNSVTGIGDDAFWGAGGLHILEGNVYLTIGVDVCKGKIDKRENRDLEKNIANLVVSRL
jgi:hypothetical protein